MSQPPPRSTLAYVLCRSWKRACVLPPSCSASPCRLHSRTPYQGCRHRWRGEFVAAELRDEISLCATCFPLRACARQAASPRAVEGEHVVRICALRDQSNLLGAHRPESRSLTTVTWTRLK